MKFRPCIDIHNGKVKQIVGGSLKDTGNHAVENFVSEKDAGFYAELYKKDNLNGGHIILLNSADSEFYEEDIKQAKKALTAFPQGMQIGGGITDKNAPFFLEQAASHVIVTSFVFKDGQINYGNLRKLKQTIGKERLVLDLSCRKMGKDYYIVTDRWQKFTNVTIHLKSLEELSCYCSEFLIHAVDVEGKASGIELELLRILSNWDKIPITYAGGIGTPEDIKKIKEIGKNKIDITIGSALDLFGGVIPYISLFDL